MLTGPQLLIILVGWVALFGGAFWLICHLEKRAEQRKLRRLEVDKRMNENRKKIIEDLIRY
ncbi:MAG: hypothetical protein IKY33_01560 [Clostridia bacterium]|nr:hypothetical protein [Clostridia bacterium]